MRIFIKLVLILFSFAALARQWVVAPHYKEKDAVYIRYGNEGYDNLKAALESIDNTKTLISINMGRLVHIGSSDLQKDIIYYLKHHNPEALGSALESAGNIHNPKVIELEQSFNGAVLNSHYFKDIENDLNLHGYRIKRISFEKFFIIRETDSIKFDAMIWLELEKSAGARLNIDLVLKRHLTS